MPTVLITGGTGTIGRRLSQMLMEKGFEVIVLSRKFPVNSEVSGNAKLSYAKWNIANEIIDTTAIAKADFIIHLAGAGVADKRWSAKRKKEIQESRTKSSSLIVKALSENENKVKAIISSSAIGWYGEDTKETISNGKGFTEEKPSANNFLGETCRLWEESINPAEVLGKRLVIIRTGIVLSNSGGAFVEFAKPLKVGVAAILGSGEQMISWIHVDDICRIYIHALEHENISGIYNGAAPAPVNNKILTLSLAKIKRGKFFIPVHIPSFVLKIVLGEMSMEVLKSTTVSSEKMQATGFQFLYPSIDAALKELCLNK